MKVLFWGTPDFAVPTLLALGEEGHDVVGVVTQPDRPAGRGRRTKPSAVKEAALTEGLPVLTPERPRGPDFLGELRALEPDVSVVVAYGHILKPEVLELPPRGSLNVHASLLPELRGAAPINWAIVRGHETTGVTIMRMTEGLDEGPVLHQVEEPIGPSQTASELWAQLSELGAQALIETLALLSVDAVEERPQDHGRATYAPKIDRDTARIDWSEPAGRVADHVRGMDAVPGAWSTLGGQSVKLFRPVPETDRRHTAPPGEVVSADPEAGLLVVTGDGAAVRFEEVQPPGKRRMAAADWLRGRGVARGDRFA